MCKEIREKGEGRKKFSAQSAVRGERFKKSGAVVHAMH
jgi:hypothetical protein